MSGASIAAEVAAALTEVATDVGAGAFVAYLIRPAAQPNDPWGAPAGSPVTYNLPALDMGMKLRMEEGTRIQRRAHIVMLPALGLVPLTSDLFNMRDREYNILAVETVAPSGVDLYYQIEIDAGRPNVAVPGVDPPELVAPPEGQDW